MSSEPYDSHEDRGRQSDLAVMGVDEYKQKRRLERILDAHDEVEDVYELAIEGAYLDTDIRPEGIDVILLHQVQKFIREMYNALKEHASEVDGRDKYWFGDPEQPLGVIHFEHGENEEFVGLRDVVHADYVYSRIYTEQVKPRNMPQRSETRSETRSVPKDISWRAYLLLKEFCEEERNLDLSYDGEEPLDEDVVIPDY